MPDIRGATVVDDLPESIIAREIFLRLSSKDVVRCGAVSRSWRVATSSNEFLRDHHRRQPSLPLLAFPLEGAIDALDIREAPAKRQPILRNKTRDRGSILEIYASCEGLLLVLSGAMGGFHIINPTTRQCLALARPTREYGRNTWTYPAPFCWLDDSCGKVAGMYPHPHRSGEYGILFRRGESTDRNARYYILTAGSSQKKQKTKCIGPTMASGISMWDSPVLLNGCLHWVPSLCPEDGLLLFDTVKESFRWMRVPAIARGGNPTLLEMEGKLGMWCVAKRVMKIWVLEDYQREVWSLKREIELPMVKYWSYVLLSPKRGMWIYSAGSCLHYDDNGKLLDEFQWETNYYRNITGHLFKESLIRHALFSNARW